MGCDFSCEDFGVFPECIKCKDLLVVKSKTGKCLRCHPVEKVEFNSLIGGRCNQCREKFWMEGNKKFCNWRCQTAFVESWRCCTCLTQLEWGVCRKCDEKTDKRMRKEDLANMAAVALCKYCSDVLPFGSYGYCRDKKCREYHDRQYYVPLSCPECNASRVTPYNGPCYSCRNKPKTQPKSNFTPYQQNTTTSTTSTKKKKKYYLMRNGRVVRKWTKK